MYIQIKNSTLPKNNQIQSTKETIGQAVRKAGWKLADCKFTEIRTELVETKYRGADGKTVPSGTRQYKSRAKSSGTLNIKNKVKMSEALNIKL